MTKRIFRSFCLVAGIVFLASLLLIMGVLYDYFSGMQRASLKQQTALAAQGIASCGTAYCDGLKADGLRITWIDASGKVLYDSDSDAASMENHLERAEVREALKQGYGESSRYSSTLMKRQFYAAQRLEDGTVVRLSVSQYSLLTLFMGMLPQIACVTLIAAARCLCGWSISSSCCGIMRRRRRRPTGRHRTRSPGIRPGIEAPGMRRTKIV